jgi:hypothetical protein
MSVLGNAKSNRHRKTYQVESGDAGRKSWHLTRGDLPSERLGEVSRGHSSVETQETAWSEGPKEPFTRREVSGVARTVFRNRQTQQLRQLSVGRHGQVRWIPRGSHAAGGQQHSGRNTARDSDKGGVSPLGGRKAARSNRRMRKTARPVVWEG